MKKKIIASVIAALLSTTALADTSALGSGLDGIHGVLENSYIRAGVNSVAGSFGSGGNTTPGLLYDSTGTGTFNTSYDYLTPGSPFDGFSIKIDGVNSSNNNGRAVQWETVGGGLVDGENTLTWSGANAVHPGWSIENIYSLGATSQYVDITTNITAGSAASDVWFSRHIDPDARAAAGDSSSTDNVLGYGVIPSSNVAFSEALSSRYALGIYSTDSNVDAGISGWSQEADGYTENTVDGDGSLTNTGDKTIGLSWHWTGVASGDILTANYAYIFGPSAFAAAETAIAGGAGGGADTSSWGTLTDVGSATDAATSGATGGSTPVITTETVINTSLPILTAGITHHTASEADGVQTIDRETTTTVTTPYVTNTYTDGVLTSSVAADSEIVTTVTNPGSFVGRIDQVATASDIVGSALRVVDFTKVNGVLMDNKYDNGMGGTTRGVVAGGTTVKEGGIIVGAGVAKLTTAMTGNGDATDAETTAISGVIGKRTEQGDLTARVTHGMTDYTMSRTIGDFANAGATKGTDTSVALRFEGNERAIGVASVSPILGVTRGERTVDAYIETGSIQSARTVDAVSEMYTFATVGASIDVGPVNLVALHNTDGVNDISLGIEKATDKVIWSVRANRTMTNLGDTNSVSAGIAIKF